MLSVAYATGGQLARVAYLSLSILNSRKSKWIFCDGFALFLRGLEVIGYMFL